MYYKDNSTSNRGNTFMFYQIWLLANTLTNFCLIFTIVQSSYWATLWGANLWNAGYAATNYILSGSGYLTKVYNTSPRGYFHKTFLLKLWNKNLQPNFDWNKFFNLQSIWFQVTKKKVFWTGPSGGIMMIEKVRFFE